MESIYLKTLCSVLDTGSFSGAAKELNITQSAVSQRVKFIEEHFDATLIDRSGGKLTLTEAGEIVVKKALQILAIEKELADELLSRGSKSRLSLCCTPTFGIVYLPRVLNLFFMANTSDVDFKFIILSPAQALKGVAEHDFDMAVIEHCGALHLAGASVLRLPDDEMTFIASPELRLSAPDVTLEELQHHRIIARREGCSSRCLLVENLTQFGTGLGGFRSVTIYDDLYLTLQSVVSKRGTAFVSRSLVKDYVRRGEITEHRVPGFRNFRSRSLVFNPERIATPLAASFKDCVLNVFDHHSAL